MGKDKPEQAKDKTTSFLATLRQRRLITVPPENVEILNINEGDLLNVTVELERRRNNDDKKTKE